MSIIERHTRLRAAREQLVPILTVLDDCEEHHIAAIISTALDTLEAKIAHHGPPAASSGIGS
jgi:hypothetical protein